MAARSRITTHVLDASNGVPASGVDVQISVMTGSTGFNATWQVLASGKTDSDGRCTTLLLDAAGTPLALTPGVYKLDFATAPYFEGKGQKCFFPFCSISFEVPNPPQPHYHVPLLLSNYSYSTYRGS
ncbi:hydroxyisourate hydrolase [Synchytrium microbalum]|uniref:5-hydroxyisourate hydrolase n=1 Tax=Synchytrium microbalum TaxID=1806994 RepID=A0A507C7P1_9FUNG|nr:hydroxyisourate hydrolase [Synchytrium microbalum]TPX33505.1 hydroxyisourate hydrolase [Synchytrium microbalum]